MSASSGIGNYADNLAAKLEHVVECLQREMIEMREKIVVLENAVRAIPIQIAVQEQWHTVH